LDRQAVFRRPLTRAAVPEYRRHTRAGGSHQGIESPNVHPLLAAACTEKNGINVTTYQALHTTIDYDGLLDLLELRAVRESWQHAMLLDLDEQRGQR